MSTATLAALQAALGFAAVGNRAGNVTVGRGTLVSDPLGEIVARVLENH